MSDLQVPHDRAGRLLTFLDEAITCYEALSSFSCGGSLQRLYGAYVRAATHYGDFTSKEHAIKCAPITIRWDSRDGASKRTTFDPAPFYRDWDQSLDDLIGDCEPATFGFNGKNMFDEDVRKAGTLEAYKFSTNFNPYDYGIVDVVAQKLRPGIVRAGRQSAVDHWGVVAELYKLNVYSSPSGIFKPHIDTPRGRTQFGSLAVCLPTAFEGGQLRVFHRGKEQVFNFSATNEFSDIKWAAFYSDCEHEVLRVTSGHRVTLTYQLYVSEHVGGLVQPKFRDQTSVGNSLYRNMQNMLSSHQFMADGGVLGFHCTYRYPHTSEGTYNYEKYPRTLKGIDAVLFTLFRAFELTVHIKAYEGFHGINGDPTIQGQGLTSAQNGSEDSLRAKSLNTHNLDATIYQISSFDCTHYVDDEIFQTVTWFNDMMAKENGKEYHEIAKPVINWIGNENEIVWEFASLALLVVVPAFPKRQIRDIR